MYFDTSAINKCNFVVKEFYGKDPILFNNITNEKINKLKQKSLQYNTFFNQNKGSKLERYVRVIEMHKYLKRDRKFADDAEKVICFMFSIDPSFEIIKIVNEFNRLDEVKRAIINKFGVYDINLIKLEKYYVSHFFSKEEKKELDEEIEKRIWE